MPEHSHTIAFLLHRIARLSLPSDTPVLDLDADEPALRRDMQRVREALPVPDCADDEILCLSCFYAGSAGGDRMLGTRAVERELTRRGFPASGARELIAALRGKGLLEVPTVLLEPDGDNAHTVLSAPGFRERLRVVPSVAARLRLRPGNGAAGYRNIREHLRDCFAVAGMLHDAVRRPRRSAPRGDDDIEEVLKTDAPVRVSDELRRRRDDLALRESQTRLPLPLLRLARALRLDDIERDMLVTALWCSVTDDDCQVQQLRALLRTDPFTRAQRGLYLSPASTLFYYDVLRVERGFPSDFHPRADVTVNPAIRDWLLTGEGDPLQGLGGTDEHGQPLPYASNREHLSDWLRYIGARRRAFARGRRGRGSDDDAQALPAPAPDLDRLRLLLFERERSLMARCDATAARFPLHDITERCGLSAPERDVLLLLLERDMCGLDTEVRDVLAFFDADAFDLARYRRLLAPDAPLLRHGLVTMKLYSTFDRSDLALPETVRDELLAEQPRVTLPGSTLQLDPGSVFTLEATPVGLDRVVLPSAITHTLRSAVARFTSGAAERLRAWGIDNAEDGDGHDGGAMRLLFSGPPGTGKTLTAGALARDLGRPLLVTDVSRLLSCWVGESEKAVRALFDEYDTLAERAPAVPVLLLNECDQFLGRRSARAGRSVDRMYHQMQNLFLERIERFRGILVATTNLVESLDDAFSRRFDYKLVFPLPAAEARAAIWRTHLPPALPLADDVDVDELARRFAFSGGQIAVVVRNAAVEAAVRGDMVIMRDLLDACLAEQRGAFSAAAPPERPVGFRSQADAPGRRTSPSDARTTA